ncbi:MAG: TSUP family transporter [Clostridia bacterium]|nr:TSUP family transporter [Clostridia bacterium]
MDFLLTVLFGGFVGLGVGSGGLYLIYLTLINGTAQLTAQGMNLYFFLAASAGGAIMHLWHRRADLGAVAVLGVAGAVSAAGGALLAGCIDGELLRHIFGVFMVISGIFALLRK